jgi:predicted N-formylglutamate amidohydrolase
MTRSASSRRPFLVANPLGVSPVLLMCEHASNRLPFAKGIRAAHRELLRSHWGWDIGAWALARDLAGRLAASAVGGRWSRLLIDLNRRVDDPTLIRRTAGSTVLPWNAGIGAEAIERRVLTYHTPYHAEIDRLILRRLVRGVRPILLAVHSFTPRLTGRSRRFEMGILYEHHRGLAHRLGRGLRDAGLTVRYNQPYSGMAGMMYAVDRHGSHHRLPCLEIEVNQILLESGDATRRLGGSIARAVHALLTRAGR